ncbi:MAG: M23 family metallopeptidase [Candidatus Wallbacteria bacterium]|nr:M23 family metallopeptidase [Candidatus Wallbacteria bacterium]
MPLRTFAHTATTSLALLLALATACPAEFPPEGRLTVSAYKVRQGEVLVVGVRGARGIRHIEGRFLDRLLSFYKTDTGDFESLAGVDLEDKPGYKEVRVHLVSPGGQTLVLRKAVEILEGKFSADKLTVPDKMVDFDEETTARIEDERQRLEAALARHNPRAFGASFALPVAGQLTSSFGRRRILNGKPRSPHSGADIKAPIGAVVKATAAGTVVLAEDQYLPGKMVVIDHGLGIFTGYYHLKEIRVQEGQEVREGALLGFVGMTGRVTGPHLHWMARIGKARVNPLSLRRLRISQLSSDELASPEPAEADPASRS